MFSIAARPTFLNLTLNLNSLRLQTPNKCMSNCLHVEYTQGTLSLCLFVIFCSFNKTSIIWNVLYFICCRLINYYFCLILFFYVATIFPAFEAIVIVLLGFQIVRFLMM